MGEIWVSSPSVGGGYWQRSEETIEVFEARLSTTGEGPYLRTGDLGFVHDGELFICGRLKDLIIIRGSNHHAPDIELTVEKAHPALRLTCGAAFSVEIDQEEQLVVVHEIDRQSKLSSPAALDEVITAIRQAITEGHEIQVHSVVLLRHGTILKTSSGKIQRRACRRRYLEGRFKVRAAWSASAIPGREAPKEPLAKPESARELEQWLVGEVVRHAGCDPGVVDIRKPLKEFGLSPEDMVRLSTATEMRIGAPLPRTIFEDFSNIEGLAGYLAVANIEGRGCPEGSPAARDSSVQAPPTTEPIALIGIGCRFPGADGPREFWKMLCEGTDAITEVPAERWDIDEVYDLNPLATGKMNTRWGGFLKQIDELDIGFLGLSIREAIRMDPQHRLMLEVAWEAIADAGLVPEKLAGSPIGVYVGIQGSEYAQAQFGDPNLADAYAGLGILAAASAGGNARWRWRRESTSSCPPPSPWASPRRAAPASLRSASGPKTR